MGFVAGRNQRAAALLFYIATGTATITLVWLLLVGDADAAVTRTVPVLVISCPDALGLAIPLVIALATSLSARQGILSARPAKPGAHARRRHGAV